MACPLYSLKIFHEPLMLLASASQGSQVLLQALGSSSPTPRYFLVPATGLFPELLEPLPGSGLTLDPHSAF